ncbi:MAG: DEAD/DEAH box helicase family protein [Armatimonadetes bacterium]|nr:DEAD/DEAH box helicase family protein [Armatimonadota bacterium]
MLELRGYQQRTLEELDSYLALVQHHGAKAAFYLKTDRQYREVVQLPGLPYVCLRVPTGGGKTLMACHALGIAARGLLQADRAVCLWLVPSNTIRDQTLNALRHREHPYRQAVDTAFAGQVEVMDLTEALYVQRSTLDGATTIIVSTLAALRVEDTDGRKVYEQAGALSNHFSGLSPAQEAQLERDEEGVVAHSLANVLRMRRPVVIMDEAHNARTPLSFDTLARFQPSCVVEFTATPETEHDPRRSRFSSNVLCHVSAAELKADQMVKLPIKLQTRSDWREVIGGAVQTQRALEQLAQDEQRDTGEYLRPIVLLQAQPHNKERETLTVEMLKESLLKDFRVPEEQVAVATGQTREIDDVDLLKTDCEIRFIITVQALREGWDCPFAYVLCSVAETGSGRAVEQILGRVLRMPRAQRKQRPELNCAYAFAASSRFADSANSLKDALIENGFQRFEASSFLLPAEESGYAFGPGTLPFEVAERVSEQPDLGSLPAELHQRVVYNQASGEMRVSGMLSDADAEALKSCFAVPDNRAAVERIRLASQGRAAVERATPERREPFRVPALAIRVDGQLEVFDETHILNRPWNLAECEATLSEAEFPSEPPPGAAAEVDVDDAGVIAVRFVEQVHEQLALLAGESGWTVAGLANWLDREIRHPDITQVQSSLFIHNVVAGLLENRGLALPQLGREKFRLRQAVEAKIDEYRRSASTRAYQALLFGPESRAIEVNPEDPEVCFSYDEDTYCPNWYYEGSYQFQKHYFPQVGELRAEGEEFECAQLLDQLPPVHHWVRNLERKPSTSFWLQTSTDRFYPDFVAKLEDGRILVVEYKGEDRWSNDDSREKRALGELWADRSEGRCVFVMPKGRDWTAITRSI